MGNVVSLQKAEISTFTVTLKALTLNNRQVTLALFRQLPRLLPYDITLSEDEKSFSYEIVFTNAKFWGYIKTKEGDWLIWQDGNTLYRCLRHLVRYKNGLEDYIYWSDIPELNNLDIPQLFIAV
jgi:hypothetical protein